MGFKAGIKNGGGFWNNVDGTLQGYEFTNVGPAKGGSQGEETEWCYLVPRMLIDGAKVPTTQHLFMGSMDRYIISDDRQTVTSAEGFVTIGGTTPVGRFFATLIECEPKAEALLPDLEAGDALNLSGIVGTRMRLGQEKDEKGTEKRGKRLDKAGKPTYDRTNTIVTRVYSLPNTQATASAPATSGKGQNGQTTVDELAAAAIMAALGKAKEGKLHKAKLMVPVLQFIGGDPTRKPHQQAVQKRITQDDFLASIAGVTFDGTELSL